jgi:GT2 family glycosyltransferase
VLTWNNYADTRECIESLLKVTYPNVRIIVVDNGSTDGSIRRLKEEFQTCEFISTGKNLGFAAGMNTGIRWALRVGATHVLLLNNDVVVDPEFLEPLVSLAETNKLMAAVGPVVYLYEAPGVINFAGGKIDYWRGLAPHVTKKAGEQSGVWRVVDYVNGCAMLLSETGLTQVGLLNECYFFYGEEVDWCASAKKKGLQVACVSGSIVWHKVSRSSGGPESPFSIYHRLRSKLLFMRRHARPYHWLTFSPFFALQACRIAAQSIISGDLDSLRALFGGIQSGLTSCKD